jgi:uncharacterized iron-regulated membrane protein
MTRRIFFWIHLSLGVVAGLAILIMSGTGVLLAFERQVLQFADRDLRSVSEAAGTAPRSLVEMLNTASASAGAPPSSIVVLPGRTSSVQFTIGRDRTVYVDPYTGAVLGENSKRVREFFGLVERWHRTLGESLAARGPMRAVAAASNLLFAIIIIGGCYLWIPRSWRWPSFRGVLVFRRGLKSRAREWNWHNVIGAWCAVPLVLATLTGVVISYPWANALLFRLAGSAAPVRQGPGGPPARPGTGAPQSAGPVTLVADLDPAGAGAGTQLPNWRTMTLRVPSPKDTNVTVTLDSGAGGEVEKRMDVVVDSSAGTVVRTTRFSDSSLGQRLRMLARFIHTGEEGGLLGQIIGALACLGGVVLVWTGLSLSIRRLVQHVRRIQA